MLMQMSKSKTSVRVFDNDNKFQNHNILLRWESGNTLIIYCNSFSIITLLIHPHTHTHTLSLTNTLYSQIMTVSSHCIIFLCLSSSFIQTLFNAPDTRHIVSQHKCGQQFCIHRLAILFSDLQASQEDGRSPVCLMK